MIRFHNHSRLRKRTRNQIGLPVESRSSHAAELLLVAMRLWLELDLAAMMFLAKRCLDTKRDLFANRFADAMQLAVAMHFVLAIASVSKHCQAAIILARVLARIPERILARARGPRGRALVRYRR